MSILQGYSVQLHSPDFDIAYILKNTVFNLLEDSLTGSVVMDGWMDG